MEFGEQAVLKIEPGWRRRDDHTTTAGELDGGVAGARDQQLRRRAGFRGRVRGGGGGDFGGGGVAGGVESGGGGGGVSPGAATPGGGRSLTPIPSSCDRFHGRSFESVTIHIFASKQGHQMFKHMHGVLNLDY